ncbi:SdrD B-like domain-containing protein [Kitasatospora sp. CB02891]|uniref:SdrD B-like domain-containing protein n=1 Tax=Kitasatospora sp. CB02891 TaxID=2020329 RepID=UPI001E400017|nr:SdrD B-like domain-containing protein [Kitasatospora sp. CB02891]
MQHKRSGYRRPAALAALLAAGIATGPAVSAPAATADGSVTVRVVRAVDESGTYNLVLNPGMAGVTVTLTGEDGAVRTAVTAADGTVTLKPAKATASGKYRVDVVNPKPGVLYPAFASREGLAGAPDKLSSNTEFVDLSAGKQATLTTGLWNPADYCQQNAPLATACQPAVTDPATKRTVLSYPYQARGVNQDVTDLSTSAGTGNVFGLAWDRDGRRLFSSAQAKRDTNYGPGGAGGIYVTDPATKTTKLFTTVPDAGSSVHEGLLDPAFMAAVGKESLGGLKLSEDGRDLYVVNLNNRKLYRYDATAKTVEKPKAVYAIPTPDCPSADDWRPFGLGMQDGVGYVGGVCSGQSTQKVGDLRAIVLPFDPATGKFGAAVLNQPMDHRGTPAVPCNTYNWYPWTDVKPADRCNFYGQPELGEIGFETDGSMLLSFRDRYPDQANVYPSAGQPAPPGGVMALASGDLNKACKSGDTYVMDVNLGCGITTRGKGFYDVRRYYDSHTYASYAGMALSKVENSIATSGYDVLDHVVTAGTMFTLRTGEKDPGMGQELSDGRSSFGKGSAMGDLEVLCDRAPLQIGNRVWYDPERSGLQLPQQKPVVGATVNLYDADGKKVGTAKTTARGEYYFDDTNVTGGLKPNTAYTVKLDNPADYAKGGPLYHWVPTKANVGDNRTIDSDGTIPKGGTYVERALETGGPGQNDHTFDFGFARQQGELRLVKNDQDGKPLPGAVFQLWRESNDTEGLQQDGDTKVGEPCTTGDDGTCRTVADQGAYYWQEVAPPKGYQAPEQPVLGPVVLDDEHLEGGVTTTAVNKLIPPPPTTPAPTPPATPRPTQAPMQPSGGSLAFTGTDDTALRYTLVGGVALLVAGAGVLIAVRRRRA